VENEPPIADRLEIQRQKLDHDLGEKALGNEVEMVVAPKLDVILGRPKLAYGPQALGLLGRLLRQQRREQAELIR